MRQGRRDTLNFLMKEEQIFNREDCEYFHVVKFCDFRKSKDGLLVDCELSNKTRESLFFSFYEKNIIRVQFGKKEFRRFNVVNLNLPGRKKIAYYLKEENPYVAVDDIKVLFKKNEGIFTVLRGNEELIGYLPENEMAWFGYITYQLGLGKNSKGNNFTYFTFRLSSDEHIYGGGEQFSGIDQRARRLKGWITDTLGLNSTPLIYKWVPFFLSSRKFGIFFNSSAKAIAEIGNVSFISASFRFEEPNLDFFILIGDSLKSILSNYTFLTGRPPKIPVWSYGIWLSRCHYRNRKELESVANKARVLNFPADVIHLDPLWLKNRKDYTFNANDFIWNNADFPGPQEMFKNLKKRKFHISLWINPYLWLTTGLFHKNPKLILRNKAGDPIFTPLSTEQAIYDLTRPETRKFYSQQLKKLLGIGVDVFYADYGENIPEEAVFCCGDTGTIMHNLFPYIYNELVYETVRHEKGDESLVFGRSGFAGSQKFPVCWSGDSQATWDVVPQVLCGGLNAGISGIPFWTCDIGGFVGMPEEELYIRWAQFGLLISHSRFHGCGVREPWLFGKRAFDIVKNFAEIRYQLITYLYNIGIEASLTGLPVIRPMVLEFEDDPTCQTISDQYMLGSALLVKPVLKKGVKNLLVYLPAGKWLDFFSDKIYEGPKWVNLPVTLDTIPIFQRENTGIPINEKMCCIEKHKFKKFRLKIFAFQKDSFSFFLPGTDKLMHVEVKEKKSFQVLQIKL